jgi:hypothetical protein
VNLGKDKQREMKVRNPLRSSQSLMRVPYKSWCEILKVFGVSTHDSTTAFLSGKSLEAMHTPPSQDKPHGPNMQLCIHKTHFTKNVRHTAGLFKKSSFLNLSVKRRHL